MSRDCYFVTIGWDYLGDDFSSAQQEQMQVRGPKQLSMEKFTSHTNAQVTQLQNFLIKMIPVFRNSITKVCLSNRFPPPYSETFFRFCFLVSTLATFQIASMRAVPVLTIK